jgi:hypothetical protein
MTLLQKIENLTWWNEPNKLKVILKELLALVSGGTGVQSITGDVVDNTDPLNPIIGIPTLQEIITSEGGTSVADGGILLEQTVGDVTETLGLYWNAVDIVKEDSTERSSIGIHSPETSYSEIIFQKNNENGGAQATITNKLQSIPSGAVVYNLPDKPEGEYELAIASPISGTFANPISITVVNGVITAIL